MTNLYGMLMGSGLCALPVNSQLIARTLTEDEKTFNFLTQGVSSDESLFNTDYGTRSHGWDVLLNEQVEKHAMCFDGKQDANDAVFCNPEDQIENNKDIAKSSLRLLHVTIPKLRYNTIEQMTQEMQNIYQRVPLRTTDEPGTRDHGWDVLSHGNDNIHERFDVWYGLAQNRLESKNQQDVEAGANNQERTNEDQYFPADWEDIVEFFEMLYSSPDENSDFERFMILYDKLLDWVFARYFAIAKSEDGDGSDETWNGKTEDEANQDLTFHLFASYAYDFNPCDYDNSC